MKTKILSILFLVICFNVSSEEMREASLSLFTYDHQGKELISREVRILNSSLIVDKVELSPIEVTIKSKYISKLMNLKNSEIKKCSEGVYKLQKKYLEQDDTETGCLSSKRFSEINYLFQMLRKDVVLK